MNLFLNGDFKTVIDKVLRLKQNDNRVVKSVIDLIHRRMNFAYQVSNLGPHQSISQIEFNKQKSDANKLLADADDITQTSTRAICLPILNILAGNF